MRRINGEAWLTIEEVRARVISATERIGRNDSRDASGLSFRYEGFPGTGGGTVAWSYVRAGRREGVTYYREIPYAG